ncbi:MAG: hypothetical protein LBQ66_15860 [Planctomycetaceae bacterium]|nr:hypothetical protein [Planctomycetaceae bacterium]
MKIERKVDAILTILEKHFGEVDESIVERIRIVRNNFVLDDLVVYALNCETITEFSDVLQRYIDEVHVELIDEYIYKRKS